MSDNKMTKQPESKVAASEEVQKAIEAMNAQDRNTAYRPLKLYAIINKDRIWVSQQGSDEPLKKYERFDCQIVAAKITRVCYANREQKAPSCVSSDGGHTGSLHPEYGAPLEIQDKQECAACKWNQWGTAKNTDGTVGKGKMCKERRNLLALHADFQDPVIVSISPMSIGAWDAYASGLTQLRPASAYIAQLTRISVQIERNESVEFGKATFQSIGSLPQEAVAQGFALRKEYLPLIGEIVITEPETKTAARTAAEQAIPADEEIPF